jgi:nitroimidazol reductase NimA-like FMN-containing flavoprotein (pyridoxamine 5'-phosphate oxidase superfamily)
MADAEQIYRTHPTDEEIADVLASLGTAAVGTVNADGSVHLAYVIFLHRDGRTYFETASVTRKARNVKRTGRLSMLVQGTASTGRQLMVSLEGTGRVLDGDEAIRINHDLRAKYIKPEALDEIDRAWNGFDDVAVELTTDLVRSWTGSTMHTETQQHLTVPYDSIWL